LDLPKTFAIDYIVDNENRHKVRGQKKYAAMICRHGTCRTIEPSKKRAISRMAQHNIDINRSGTDAE
jgi:hypothetical protein